MTANAWKHPAKAEIYTVVDGMAGAKFMKDLKAFQIEDQSHVGLRDYLKSIREG